MEISPIAYYRGAFATKFGIPRQSGLVAHLQGRVEMAEGYCDREALRGLEAFSYVWLVWGFSENVAAQKHPTVRPPLLGGNRAVGVWATRSPFRPNNLGLSSVAIVEVRLEGDGAPCIVVEGADLMDGTPIYDIKPYLAYVDSHPEARGGFTDEHPWQRLRVEVAEHCLQQLTSKEWEVLTDVLALDPRPHYHDDERRLYGMPFAGWDVRFRVIRGVLRVEELVKI